MFLLSYSKCPDCYGDEFCHDLSNGHVQFTWGSKLFLILNPSFTKSVFFATVNGDQVVLKSMRSRGCKKPELDNYESKDIFERIVIENRLTSDEHINNIILCPNVKSVDFLYKSLGENFIKQKRLWLDMQISAEPLLLKYFQNVPVPRFHGACGNIVAKEYKGPSLTDYFKSDWRKRMSLAIQLLKMAETFTFSIRSHVFYFTDLSSDNIAVDSSGLIYLIDLDHVIIAERDDYHHENGTLGSVHTSNVMDPVKLTVVPSDICGCTVSDHNYFAVCKFILLHSQETDSGLLEDVPKEVNDKYQEFGSLLDECGEPKKYGSRIEAGRILANEMGRILSYYT